MNEEISLNDRYTILEAIADGMMGPVYRGLDIQSNKIVAIKGLRSNLLKDHPTLLERFIREGEALRQLDHPNIVQLLDVVKKGQEHYLIMEYVEGGSLSDLLHEQPQLPVNKVLEIGLDLADALTRTHRLGIIHRDIKPQNVLISTDGTPRLSDFGVAHYIHRTTVSQPGGFAGTLAYIPPESFLGLLIDERADIWSFGILLFQMLAGQLPFESISTAALINSILTKPTPDLREIRNEIDDDFCDLIYLMLAKDRENRIASARLVGAALEAIQKGTELNLVVPRQAIIGQAVPSNLPKIPTSFIGRKQEIVEVCELLYSADCRLLTLTGPGGVGKTRLALQAASASLSHFKDGVFFVDLAPITSPDLLPIRIAQTLALKIGPGRSPMDQILDILDGRRSLLILDNFEQIISAATWVSDLMSRLPLLTIFVTSRRNLNVYGEYEYKVPALSLPVSEPFSSVEAISTIESVRLFVHRARAANPRFVLTEKNASTVAQICFKLDGLPLAIELAAARTRVYSPEFMLDQLSNALEFLTRGPQDISERHQTLKTTIDWSYDLLEDDLKDLFIRSAVFHGGQSLEASESICGHGLRINMLSGLESLHDQSLLRRKESPDAQPRFEMLETIHQYAHEKLIESGEEGDWLLRYATFFTDFAEKGEKELRGPQQEIWSNILRSEYDNIRSVLDWSLTGGSSEFGLRLVGALAEFWFYEGPISDGEQWIQKALQFLGESRPDVSAKVLNGAGMLAFARGDHEAGKEWNNKALAISKDNNDKINQAWSLFWLSAHNTSRSEEYYDGLSHCKEALELFREADDKAGIAWCLNQLGEMNRLLGDLDQAGNAYKESLQLCQAIGNRRREAIAHTNLSYVAQHQGEFEKAVDLALDGLKLLHELGLEYHTAIVFSMLAGPLAAQGEAHKAAVLLGATHSIYERLSIQLQPADQVEVDEYVLSVRQILGDEAFESAFQEGRNMQVDHAVAYALDRKKQE